VYQGRPQTLSPAPDDVWSKPSTETNLNLGSTERSISTLSAGVLLFMGLRRRSLPLLIGGGVLLFRGVTGKCPVHRGLRAVGATRNGLQIEESITVYRPADQVYDLWRHLENLPRFMSHLESINVLSGNRSHWVARLPTPFRLEWDAEIVDDQPTKKLSWRSLPGGSLQHSGSVLFRAVPERGSTEIKVIFDYRPPVGRAGAAIAKLLNLVTTNQIRSDLRTFKAVAETGEKPSTAGQPTGHRLRGKNGKG
jgi:uncharacterized membrane protein